MKKIFKFIKKWCSYFFALFLLSALIFLIHLKKHYMINIFILAFLIAPFFLSLKKHKTSSKSLVLISILSAIAASSRLMFAAIPQIKPMAALVIISGICLDKKSGFITGAVSVFISNLFLGQGIWTLWQMIAFGLLGLLANTIFKFIPKKTNFICIYGGISVLLIYSTIINLSSFFMFTGNTSSKTFIAFLVASLPMDILHALSTVIFLLFLAKPITLQIQKFNINAKNI